jgi:hypothetical protein
MQLKISQVRQMVCSFQLHWDLNQLSAGRDEMQLKISQVRQLVCSFQLQWNLINPLPGE